MTLEKLLSKLRAEHEQLTGAIKTLETYVQTDGTAAKILGEVHAKHSRKKTARGFKYKPGTHWTQRPGAKAKVRAAVLKGRATREA